MATSFKERVVQERKLLSVKIKKLSDFLRSGDAVNGLPAAEKLRLGAQYKAMCEYCNVLDERIAKDFK